MGEGARCRTLGAMVVLGVLLLVAVHPASCPSPVPTVRAHASSVRLSGDGGARIVLAVRDGTMTPSACVLTSRILRVDIPARPTPPVPVRERERGALAAERARSSTRRDVTVAGRTRTVTNVPPAATRRAFLQVYLR